tara:strand:- start:90 stop:383 length:294 start_codon:yes stop_codon:yes gene_type:complete
MEEWNTAVENAHESIPQNEMVFLKVSAECWDIADFFNNEKYPTYGAYCLKKTNSGSHIHPQNGPENKDDAVMDIYDGDRTHTSFGNWINKVYKKCRK